MNSLRLLVSGDYWHEDFRDQLSRIKHPTTMVPADRVASMSDETFDLIVLAKAGRTEVDQATVDTLRQIMPDVPVVVLLGSWCEGENRSGQPLAGAVPVMWHQWESRFEKFCIEMSEGRTTDWHLPLTSSVADRVRDASPDSRLIEKLSGIHVGVSSLEKTSFEAIRDLLGTYQCDSTWIRSGGNKTLESPEKIDVLCIDANRGVGEIGPRLVQLKAKYKNAAFVVVAGFVRQQDFDMLAKHGISQLIAKPFNAADFTQMLVNALEQRRGSVLPKPSMLKTSQKSQQQKN